jgi:plasmid maintenance system antidote protein VapI
MISTPSERLRRLRDLNARKSKIQEITDALILSGYTSLDEQAKALGLHRNTAWTIIKKKHKIARLSAKMVERIIKNPDTPPSVLAAVLEYVAATA